MKKLLSVIAILLCTNCFSQTINTIIVDPPQLDSQIISGIKYYKLITGISTTDKTILVKAAADASNAINSNATQDTRLTSIENKNIQQDQAISAATGGVAFPSLRRKISASTYTITQDDNGYELWMETGCIINIQPTDGKVLQVRILRLGSAITFSPFASVTLTSVNDYRRISANGWADISYYSGNQVRIIGTLTR